MRVDGLRRNRSAHDKLRSQSGRQGQWTRPLSTKPLCYPSSAAKTVPQIWHFQSAAQGSGRQGFCEIGRCQGFLCELWHTFSAYSRFENRSGCRGWRVSIAFPERKGTLFVQLRGSQACLEGTFVKRGCAGGRPVHLMAPLPKLGNLDRWNKAPGELPAVGPRNRWATMQDCVIKPKGRSMS